MNTPPSDSNKPSENPATPADPTANAPHPAPKNRVVIKDHSKRDTFLAVAVGLVVMAILVFAVAKMGGTSRGVNAVIVDKRFIALPEVQISVGTGGLQREERAGEFRLIVQDPNTQLYYTVWVDQQVFDAHNIGDNYFLVRPQMSQFSMTLPAE